jgi:hypothetical protein
MLSGIGSTSAAILRTLVAVHVSGRDDQASVARPADEKIVVNAQTRVCSFTRSNDSQAAKLITSCTDLKLGAKSTRAASERVGQELRVAGCASHVDGINHFLNSDLLPCQ